MKTEHILATLAVVFLALATYRIARGGGAQPQSRTWLLIAAIFGAVSAWLFYNEA